MADVSSDVKEQAGVALGRVGWPLRRIEVSICRREGPLAARVLLKHSLPHRRILAATMRPRSGGGGMARDREEPPDPEGGSSSCLLCLCGRARWLMELRTGWLVSIGTVGGQRATA